MKPIFSVIRVVFPALDLLASLHGGKPSFMRKPFPETRPDRGGTISGEISGGPLCETTFSCYAII
jgi:hypothetical protein